MLMKQDFLNRVMDYFNINLYETKVWLALLSKGVASAGEIAKISGVPRSRCYDILESLKKKGFVISKIGKPIKYLGIKPHIVLEKLKNNIRNETEEKIVTISNLRKTDEFAKIDELYRNGLTPKKKEEFSAALKGRSNIAHYLNEMIKNADEEVIICTSAEDVRSKIKLFKQTLNSLDQENVKIKIALSGDETLIKKISNFLGMKIKKIFIETKFFIVDRKEILFYISKEKDKSKDSTALWINSDFFAKTFAALFDKGFGF